jgi:hypothetical protein
MRIISSMFSYLNMIFGDTFDPVSGCSVFVFFPGDLGSSNHLGSSCCDVYHCKQEFETKRCIFGVLYQ